ncbi:DUF411 domain-containing protein [Methylocaldum sp. BRCS4]|jgi:hypothetical protein|nr:DUF411 domain-containing protein [Methylocaldum sp. BRCS4]
MMITLKPWNTLLLGVWLSIVAAAQPASAAEATVYKSPTCGCCGKWVEHLRENGFQVTVTDMPNEPLKKLKAERGVPSKLASCHTAVVEGYVVEGHVPADVIKRLLGERPQVVGIAVPGMPIGSPGMEGRVKQPYKILSFDAQGNTSLYDSR